jgi:hypothetical protein
MALIMTGITISPHRVLAVPETHRLATPSMLEKVKKAKKNPLDGGLVDLAPSAMSLTGCEVPDFRRAAGQ